MSSSQMRPIITHSRLVKDFQNLGLQQGQIIMVHASVKSVGHILGGANVIIQALQEVVGKDGTLMMYAGWEDIPDFILDLPPDLRQIYYDEHPPFDPETSRAVRENSILVEFLRTFPKTVRSKNPEASMVALGKQADYLIANHSLDYGYGVNSPLAKLVELNGKVLMLGAPLDTVTLLHHAEYLTNIQKNVIHYQCPITKDGKTVWVDIEDYDTGDPHADYSFEAIVGEYLRIGKGKRGRVGHAESYLFDAENLVTFTVNWLEEKFSGI